MAWIGRASARQRAASGCCVGLGPQAARPWAADRTGCPTCVVRRMRLPCTTWLRSTCTRPRRSSGRTWRRATASASGGAGRGAAAGRFPQTTAAQRPPCDHSPLGAVTRVDCACWQWPVSRRGMPSVGRGRAALLPRRHARSPRCAAPCPAAQGAVSRAACGAQPEHRQQRQRPHGAGAAGRVVTKPFTARPYLLMSSSV
jgi:hypothetical protein